MSSGLDSVICGPTCTFTTIYSGDTTETTPTVCRSSDWDFRYCNFAVDELQVEVLKPLHVHPWRVESGAEKFDGLDSASVPVMVFDRKPFLNAYKAGRSLGC
jgi:hypothetical protein